MSLLVANYGSDSEDSNSDNEEEQSSVKKPVVQPGPSSSTLTPATKDSNLHNSPGPSKNSSPTYNGGSISDSDDSFSGHISDEDEDDTARTAKIKTVTSSVHAASVNADVIGLSGIGLSLPKPRNSSTATSSSSSTADALSSTPSSSILGSALPTPKADESAVGAPDEELEDFVKPRDWEMQEAEKHHSMRASSESGKVVSTKSKGGKVKISIPSLRDLNDDDDDEEVQDAGLKNDVKAKSKTGSGLFGLLPKPKNISETKVEKRPLIPHILTKRPTPNPTANSAKSLPTKAQPPKRPAEVPTEQHESNFFSLGDDEKLPQASFSSSSSSSKRLQVSHPDPEEYPLDFKSKTKSKSPSPAQTQSASSSTASAPMSYAQMYNMAAVDPQTAAAHMNYMSEEESEKMNLAKLAGSQKVRGKELEDMDIVDGNADSALGGTSKIQENLLREISASEESGYRPQPKKGEGPSTVSKRKHQITYLAFQAKEREQLLKNQWATNAQTKRQTQAKYGF